MDDERKEMTKQANEQFLEVPLPVVLATMWLIGATLTCLRTLVICQARLVLRVGAGM
jgi:hypothetical protein